MVPMIGMEVTGSHAHLHFTQDYLMPDIDLLTLQWCHNGHGSVSSHKPHDCLLNRWFRRRSKKTSKFRVTGLLCGEFTGDRWHKWPVMLKMFPFDDVIMIKPSVMENCNNFVPKIYTILLWWIVFLSMLDILFGTFLPFINSCSFLSKET